MNIEEMLKYQGQWAQEYKMEKKQRKLAKNREEKKRDKERKDKIKSLVII